MNKLSSWVLVILALTVASCSSSTTNSTTSSSVVQSTSSTSVIAATGSSFKIVYQRQAGGSTTDIFDGLSCATTSSCQASGGSITTNFLLGTVSGGVSWTEESVPPFLVKGVGSGGDNDGIPGISCPSALICYAITQRDYNVNVGNTSSSGLGGAVIATKDGGTTWTWQSTIPYTNFYNYISCPSTTVCFGVGEISGGNDDNGFVAATNNGVTWKKLKTPSNVPTLNGISCPTTLMCVATGFFMSSGSSQAIFTTDGGVTWQTSKFLDKINSLQVVSCPSVLVCYALASPGAPSNANNQSSFNLIKSTDGGATFTSTYTFSSSENPLSLDCPSISVCAVGGFDTSSGTQGSILISTNGGKSFSQDSVPSQVGNIMRVSCPSPTKCFAIGGSNKTANSAPGNFDKGYILSN